MGNCIIVQKSGSGGSSYTAGDGIDITFHLKYTTVIKGG